MMATIEAETINEAAVISRDEAAPVAHGNYEPVRFNAMKHGILSKLVVLAHEDHAEFSDLMAALIEEHRPAGITERHLIEELAAIIWRKRRVLLAEGAAINRCLKGLVSSEVNSPAPAAAPFVRGLATKGADLQDLMTATPEQMAEQQRCAEVDLAATHEAASILRKGGKNAYQKARQALIADSRELWDDQVNDGAHPATAEGLVQFIREYLEPICMRIAQEARFQRAIKTQTLGEGLQAHRLESLNRYETHLDRKFERTLGMLLKLKELRAG